MKGRWLLVPLLAVLAAALAAQSGRLVRRLEASVMLQRVETSSLAAARMGRSGQPLLREGLRLLRRAAEQDPSEAGIPIATGSLHLLLGNPHAAIDSYLEALALEPRPETYLNLGRAQARTGDLEAARVSFARVRTLDPRLARQIPRELRRPPKTRRQRRPDAAPPEVASPQRPRSPLTPPGR